MTLNETRGNIEFRQVIAKDVISHTSQPGEKNRSNRCYGGQSVFFSLPSLPSHVNGAATRHVLSVGPHVLWPSPVRLHLYFTHRLDSIWLSVLFLSTCPNRLSLSRPRSILLLTHSFLAPSISSQHTPTLTFSHRIFFPIVRINPLLLCLDWFAPEENLA